MNLSSIIGRIPPVTKNLLAINIIVWLISEFLPAVGRALDNNLALYYIESPAFKPFQLFTYMFLHADFIHLFFNMFALWMFGSVIERALSSKRFLIYFLTCGFGAALIQEGVFAIMIAKYHDIFSPEQFDQIITQGCHLMRGFQNYADPTLGTLNMLVNAPVVGASGAVYGVLLAFGMLFPNQPIYIMFVPVPIKAKWMVIGYIAIELFMGLGGIASNVAHWAHLGGVAIGFLLILYWKKRGDLNDRWYF